MPASRDFEEMWRDLAPVGRSASSGGYFRQPWSAAETELRAGGVVLDLRSRRATVGGREVDLSAREFALAEVLMTNAGTVLTREQLLSRVWGYDYDGGSNVVDVYVRYLRRKLGPSTIETVRGAGYRFTR